MPGKNRFVLDDLTGITINGIPIEEYGKAALEEIDAEAKEEKGSTRAMYPTASDLREMSHEELLAHKADHGMKEEHMAEVPDYHMAHHDLIDQEAQRRGGYDYCYQQYLAGRGHLKAPR